jgi:hypothetical protein
MEEQVSEQGMVQEGFVQEEPAKVISPGFDQLFKKTTDIWKNNLADLVLVTLVFCLVAWIPIVNIAFSAGYVRALLKAMRGEKPMVVDIFSAWDCFGSALVYGIVVFIGEILLMMVPVLGWVAMMILFLAAAPGFYALADRNLAPIAAMKWSLAAFKADLGNWVAVLLIGSLVAKAGLIVLVLGVLFTLPWGYLLIALQYESQGDLAALEEE